MPTANRPAPANPDRGTQTPSSESSAQGTMQRIKDQASDMVDSATDMAGQAKDKVQEMASNVASQVKDKTQEYASVAAEKAEDLGKEMTLLIRRYPVQALLVGFGIGMLLGRMSRV